VIVEPSGDAHRLTLDVRGAYSVGSGDAFLAGLVVGLERGACWSDAARLAVGAAVASAEVPGAGLLDPQRARELARWTSVGPLGNSAVGAAGGRVALAA